MADQIETAEPQAAEATPEPKPVGDAALEDALDAMFKPALNGTPASPEAPVSEDSPAGSVADEAALKPGDAPRSPDDQAGDEPTQEGEQPKLSRRQQEEQARRAEIQAAIEAHEREKDARIKAEQETAAARAEIDRANNAALAALGSDAEFNRLYDIRMRGPVRGEYLSADEDDKLNQMIRDRELGAAFHRMADLQVRRTQTAQALAEADKYGLDASRLDPTSPTPPALPEILEHAVAATEARVRGELEPQLTERDQRIADLETEMEALRTRAVGHSRAPVTSNGRSGAAVAGSGYDTSRSPLDNLDDYFAAKIPG